MENTKTIRELAAEVSKMFVKGARDNGQDYWHRVDNAPEWVTELSHTAHRDMFPDDHKCLFVVEALDTISETEEDNLDSPEIEADVYYHELLTWFSSHMERVERVDDIIAEYGKGKTIMDDITAAQAREKEEVYFSVLSFLRDKLEEMNTEEEGEDNE